MNKEPRLAVFKAGQRAWWTTLVARKGGEWKSVCAGGDSCRECPAGGRCRDFQFASLEEAELRLAAEGLAVGKKAEDPRVLRSLEIGFADRRMAEDLGKYPCWEVERIS